MGKKRSTPGFRAVLSLPDRYGISDAEWVAMWRAQDGKCAICLRPLRNRYDPGSPGAVANVDHDHRKQKTEGTRASVRGLLCAWDNHRTLGHVHDDVAKLERAVEYLKRPPARAVLDVPND